MAALLEIKSRIQSTEDTKKTTRALELVAASRMKYFQRRALASRSYAGSLLEALTALDGELGDTVFAKKNTSTKKLFVLVTSDKGLCGSLNYQLTKQLFSGASWNSLAVEDRLLVAIGRKSVEAAKRYGVTPVASFEGIGEDITPLTALRMVDTIVSLWKEGDVSEVVLVSPHYVNPFESHVTFKTFLPLSKEMAETHMSWHGDVTSRVYGAAFLEPGKEILVEDLATQLVLILFTEAFYELKASEYSSRMVAMKKASDAAQDMLEDLTRVYNRARQTAITQQLAELVGATESFKEAH